MKISTPLTRIVLENNTITGPITLYGWKYSITVDGNSHTSYIYSIVNEPFVGMSFYCEYGVKFNKDSTQIGYLGYTGNNKITGVSFENINNGDNTSHQEKYNFDATIERVSEKDVVIEGSSIKLYGWVQSEKGAQGDVGSVLPLEKVADYKGIPLTTCFTPLSKSPVSNIISPLTFTGFIDYVEIHDGNLVDSDLGILFDRHSEFDTEYFYEWEK